MTVNFDTGETKFAEDRRPSTTRYVKEFQAWCKAKAGRCDS